MHSRGQSSFELLLLVAFVIALSVVVLSPYFSVAPSVYATAVLKSTASEAWILSGNYDYRLVEVSYAVLNNRPTFDIQTAVSGDGCAGLDSSELGQIVAEKAGVAGSLVTINGQACPMSSGQVDNPFNPSAP